MIRTTHLTSDLNDIPSNWVFEHYCGLTERLTGQELKIKSLFNQSERTPSFTIFFSEGKYYYKDFSSGHGGTAFNFVMILFNLSSSQTAAKLLADYNEFVLSGKDSSDTVSFQKQSKYQVTNYTTRQWIKDDADFWTKFQIDSQTLARFKVLPVENYWMEKETGERLVIKGSSLYAYTRLDGTIYKIYQPRSEEHKFLKVKNYIQGTDQLKFDVPNLVICSSLKDAMCLTKFGYNTEVVAPDSENSLIPNGAMSMYKLKYKAICTLFDNDDAGIKAAQKYQDEYDLPSVILPMSKDLSDSIRDYGIPKTREVLHPLLKEALKK
jgi:DNA primase